MGCGGCGHRYSGVPVSSPNKPAPVSTYAARRAAFQAYRQQRRLAIRQQLQQAQAPQQQPVSAPAETTEDKKE